jgi:hypothetical protein
MPFQPTRRALLRTVPAASLLFSGVTAAAPAAAARKAATPPDPWQRANDIIARFATPLVFRKEDFDVTAYGIDGAGAGPGRFARRWRA